MLPKVTDLTDKSRVLFTVLARSHNEILVGDTWGGILGHDFRRRVGDFRHRDYSKGSDKSPKLF